MKQNILHSELSYKITGLCFKVQNDLGRFCREKQYSDYLEDLLKGTDLKYKRECQVSDFNNNSPAGNVLDFLIEDKIILEIKAKKFILKDDYNQTQRYLQAADLDLGLIINFRNTYLKPKRVLNIKRYSDNSDKIRTLGSNRGFTLVETLVAMSVFSILILLVSGIYLNVNNLQKNTASFQRLQNEGRYITEKIAKEFRARELDMATTFDEAVNPLDAIYFYKDEFGDVVNIYYDEADRGGEVVPSISYSNNGSVDYLNSADVEVVGVRFYVWPSIDNPWGFAPVTNIQPRLTIWLKIQNNGVAEKHRKELTIQTTISSKVYKR